MAVRRTGWRDWMTVVACLVCQIGMGVGGYIMPVFLKPVAAELGWSRTIYASANPIMSTVVALAGPLVGSLSARVGPRGVLVAGSVLMGGALTAAGAMQTTAHWYVVAVMVGLAVACLGDLPTGAAIAGRFERSRGLALGLVYIGSSIGGALGPLVATELASGTSWRDAFRVIGVGLTAAVLPFALLVTMPRDRVRTLRQAQGERTLRQAQGERTLRQAQGERTLRQAQGERKGFIEIDPPTARAELVEARGALWKERDFWLLFWVIFVFYLYRLGVNVHLVAYLSDLGYSDAEAASRFSLTLGIGIAGKLLAGTIADRIGVRTAVVGNFAVIAVASALLLAPQLPMAIPLFLVLHGAATAAEDVVVPLLIGQRFGVDRLASVYGVLMLALIPGGSIGPLLAGRVFDLTGSYAGVFAVFVACNLLAVPALLTVSRTRNPSA